MCAIACQSATMLVLCSNVTVSVKKFTWASVRLEWSLDHLGRHINIVIIITHPALDEKLSQYTGVVFRERVTFILGVFLRVLRFGPPPSPPPSEVKVHSPALSKFSFF